MIGYRAANSATTAWVSSSDALSDTHSSISPAPTRITSSRFVRSSLRLASREKVGTQIERTGVDIRPSSFRRSICVHASDLVAPPLPPTNGTSDRRRTRGGSANGCAVSRSGWERRAFEGFIASLAEYKTPRMSATDNPLSTREGYAACSMVSVSRRNGARAHCAASPADGESAISSLLPITATAPLNPYTDRRSRSISWRYAIAVITTKSIADRHCSVGFSIRN